MKRYFVFTILFFQLVSLSAQDTTTVGIAKKGWNLGGVPAIAYNTDLGFTYGLILNLYHYGDGTIYPNYKHNIYMEWSRTTKGNGNNEIRYDSKYLIPGIRFTGQIYYQTEKGLDFYGFNGYKSFYNANLTDPESSDYRSRMYYKHDRKMLRLKADLQDELFNDKFRWMLGFSFNQMKLDTVDISKLNQGKSGDDILPPVNGGLFGTYLANNAFPEDEKYGGNIMLLKGGLVFDTRDNEPNPNKGVWIEGQLIYSPSWLGSDNHYLKLALTHRQYFTLLPNKLTFAYRISYQPLLAGKMPYYMQPFVYNVPPGDTKDALGGSKTVRGIARNRLVGEDYLFGNNEFRWKFYNTVMFNQNFYLALTTFFDYGMVTKPYNFNNSNIATEYYYPEFQEELHTSVGTGLFIAYNENFIIAVQYGKAIKEQDGDSGFYINLNFVF